MRKRFIVVALMAALVSVPEAQAQAKRMCSLKGVQQECPPEVLRILLRDSIARAKAEQDSAALAKAKQDSIIGFLVGRHVQDSIAKARQDSIERARLAQAARPGTGGQSSGAVSRPNRIAGPTVRIPLEKGEALARIDTLWKVRIDTVTKLEVWEVSKVDTIVISVNVPGPTIIKTDTLEVGPKKGFPYWRTAGVLAGLGLAYLGGRACHEHAEYLGHPGYFQCYGDVNENTTTVTISLPNVRRLTGLVLRRP